MADTVKDVSERLDKIEADLKQRLDNLEASTKSYADELRRQLDAIDANNKRDLQRVEERAIGIGRTLQPVVMLTSCLAVIDDAIRADRAHDGPPGSGLHRILSAMAAGQMGITVAAFSSAPPDQLGEPIAEAGYDPREPLVPRTGWWVDRP